MKALRLFRTRPPLPSFCTDTARQVGPSRYVSRLARPFHSFRVSQARRYPTLRSLPQWYSQPFKSPAPRRPYSNHTNPHTQATAQLTFSQRFRKLGREYGWSATGIYFLLSALDFPFCFAAVRWLGPERVGNAERVVVDGVRGFIPDNVKTEWNQLKVKLKEVAGRGIEDGKVGGKIQAEQHGLVAIAEVGDGYDYDHGVREAERENRGEHASLWTQLALAYAIHKSFIFIRLPITVAVTPKVVKVLRGWGWNIGKRKPKGL
ncbi:uncharacterized protein KY384_007029 [Bacidia gigantensis]|uniref:uncharacterized protein n=1 Tax=Bacidia gigantensis TaxID=2732470 RepID=UPI001D05895A|nr:uncharacterized protein KY384_007029 [Bacidia gigantensis]KAG8528113.1 hypothetical protein KY384_007029 [Bacidia gigantensis]